MRCPCVPDKAAAGVARSRPRRSAADAASFVKMKTPGIAGRFLHLPRGLFTEEIRLPQRQTLRTQDGVSSGHVEEEIRQ